MTKKQMKYNRVTHVYTGHGLILRREYHSRTPAGNDIGGRWVLRNDEGTILDYDKYRFDLAERHGLELYQTTSL